ncbi:MAG: T9SS type A sorting domain-containing protein [Bacteroidota bacterium]
MKKFFFLLLILAACIEGAGQDWQLKEKLVPGNRAAGNEFGVSVSISGRFAIIGSWGEGLNQGGNSISSVGAAYIYERIQGKWTERQKIIHEDPSQFDGFGYAVAMTEQHALVGVPQKSLTDSSGSLVDMAGLAYVFEQDSSGQWLQSQQLHASDPAQIANFGFAVAISGEYLVVGAVNESRDTMGGNFLARAGAAYVFEKSPAGIWEETQKITASDREFRAQFGQSVAIHAHRLVVGAFAKDEISTDGNQHLLSNTGAAYIFERDSNGVWLESQKIAASDRKSDDGFGFDVAMDADHILAGAPNDDHDTTVFNLFSNAGSAYLFEQDSTGNWIEVQKLLASDKTSSDFFGISIAIDGGNCVIGAYQHEFDEAGTNMIGGAGAAYVFQENQMGNWIQTNKLVSSDRGSNERFGEAISMSGNAILVGVKQDREDMTGANPMNNAGSAFLFLNCGDTTGLDSVVACFHYTSPSGRFTWTNSGTYQDTIPTRLGCDSVLTLYVTIVNIDTTVLLSGARLEAQATEASYQWLYCDSAFAPIPGAIDSVYLPQINGTYAVEISQDGCQDTSACFSVLNVGIVANELGEQIRVYPNPVRDVLSIDLGQVFPQIRIRLLTVTGQELNDLRATNIQQTTIDLQGPAGVYFLNIQTKEDQQAWVRVLKQ